MNTVRLEPLARGTVEIPLQPASADIWDKKYRLKTKDGTPIDVAVDDTWKRVAEALAEVEATPEKRQYWHERFLWALRRGAIPAGRITSNAGAREHKPKTSTINCTVSGTIDDSMDDILQKVHEAGLTLKAGCVAPGTWVVTERGLVTADEAVAGRHAEILSYDREARRFEMRRIERHLVTEVRRADNIRLHAGTLELTTSVRHPVLVYRDGRQRYVRADEVGTGDALVQHAWAWTAEPRRALEAWFAGAHLGDGSAWSKKWQYQPTRAAWKQRAQALGQRLVFRIRAAERELVERYAAFFAESCGSRAQVVAATTPRGTPVWDFSVSSFAASRAVELVDGQKTAHLRVPAWIASHPERHFLPFLAGLIDADGTVDRERGSVTIATQNVRFAAELQALLGLFGVHGGLTERRPRSHEPDGHVVRDTGGAMLEVSDSAFLAEVARHMADGAKRRRILEHASQAGQYDRYRLPEELATALQAEFDGLGHRERQELGFYHGYHRAAVVSRIWLDRWAARFPALRSLVDFARRLRPVERIERGLDLPETFYDFTVERHNNYLAGNGGLAVIHNCGIGYEFSTLRPRGAYVSGAGAYTSGPLSFMDIYDKMCFTVSSAGGRRGAQMGTFDVSHPDVREFIRAKREAGRLRQFNLSLLVTDGFMQAVERDADWPLVFPVHVKEQHEVDLADPAVVVWREWPTSRNYVVREDGLVACKVYGHVRARHLWDMIMVSTYDYAEPGFILIDRVNAMNNNWWCEHIRATNPCVTADTWVHTSEGPRQVRDLLGRPFLARIDGEDHATTAAGFFRTATKPVLALATEEGHRLRLTADHRVRRVSRLTRWSVESEWCAAGDLAPGDRVLLQDHRGNPEWPGALDEEQGYLLGLLVGDGTLKHEAAVLSAWTGAVAANGEAVYVPTALMAEALRCAQALPHRADFAGWSEVAGRGEFRLKSAALRDLAHEFGLAPGAKTVTAELERASSRGCRGFLRGLFDADGSVQGNHAKGISVRLAQSDLAGLEAVQRMLLRLGIPSRIHRDRRPAGTSFLPDGQGGSRAYPVRAQHELVIAGESLARFAELVGFVDAAKAARLRTALAACRRGLNRARFVATVASLEAEGCEDVYDVQVPGINSFDGNGLHAHNCGEQPLPPYGSCLLGSVNLTKFVRDPFGPKARFDWDEYREVVRVFTRMLDNVVEVNGLPLAEQRAEIESKRRHGMGFLGLGSTLAMLKLRYGSERAVAFTEEVAREMAIAGWEVALELGKEKGPAPVLARDYEVTRDMLRKRPEMAADGWKAGDRIPGRVLHARYSRYMQQLAGVAPQLVAELAETGARFTHHSSIAPTGTISLSLANNASNGIEPSFAHHYSRNVIREGRKTKEKVEVYSYELLAYRELINGRAMPFSTVPEEKLPEYFVAADDVSPTEHVDMQAAAQKWVDSSISKTANVPTDYPYEKFKDIYLYAWRQGLKGCTTFRFNPEAFQGVLVKEEDLAGTTYRFELEDGSVVELRGNEEIEYDGEKHTAANLFDALKEGYYGKF